MTIKEIVAAMDAVGATNSNLSTWISRQPQAQRAELERKRDSVIAHRKARHERAARAATAAADRATAKAAGLTVAQLAELRTAMPSFATGHSMGSKLDVVVVRRDGRRTVVIRRDMTQEYAKSCKWRAKHGYITVTLTPKEARGRLIGGLYTVPTGHAVGKVQPCKWLTTVGHCSTAKVVWVDGYVTGGYHSGTIEECLQWRAEQAARLLEGRQRAVRFVGLSYALSRGLCEAGIMAFAKAHGLDPEMGYSLTWLMAIATDHERPYVSRL